jgi:C-terminal processing protease CtpA/Prc
MSTNKNEALKQQQQQQQLGSSKKVTSYPNEFGNTNDTGDSIKYPQLVTYELTRPNASSFGFGFDLKGDRPAVIGNVRRNTIADQAGIEPGDIVVSINNRKVTDLDHDQVVRLIGLSKSRLKLQVTKIIKTKSINNLNEMIVPSDLMMPLDHHLITKKSVNKMKQNNNDFAFMNQMNQTKTTEEDDEEDSDRDYDFYLMTGGRR